MINLDRYNEDFIQDMSTIKFARSVWPQMVRELKAAREVVEMARKWNAAVEGEGRPDIVRRDVLRAVANYDEATKQ